jgi:hypothetical protein
MTGTKAQERAVAFTGTRPLSEILEHNQVMRAAREASLAEAEGTCLYYIRKDGTVGHYEITRQTAKTVYFAQPGWWYLERDWVPAPRPDGTMGTELRYTGERKFHTEEDGRVSRAVLERDGEVCRCIYGNARYRSAGFGGKTIPPGHIIYASKTTAEAVASGDPKQLRRVMANAHPDRGGTSEEFIAARKRYEQAVRRAS